ncbi:MAG: response regulator transcription factor [Ignavibacteriae bacterium]|nr:response regulator transcription factor [Ignavibacteriota bacterium]
MTMLNILIADDHAIVRQGLKQIIAEQTDMHVIAETSKGREVLALLSSQKCDLVILDVTMPDRNGLDVLKDIKLHYPAISVLMLSMHPEDQYALRAFRAGASGYIMKDSAPVELVNAIRKVIRGHKYMSESVADMVASEMTSPANKLPHELLSDREFEVLRFIASGKNLTEIGEILSLSVKTISTYRARILIKMNLKNNTDLIHYGIEHSLTT